MPQKRQRHAALLRLVGERAIGSQDELVRLLRRCGFSATQASISRDVRELGLVKLNGRYLPAARVGRRFNAADGDVHPAELVTAVDPVGANLIVVKTLVGAASTVAVDLDRRALREIAGTIAGDDTVFVAVRSRTAQGRVLADLRARLPVGA